jgi:hypothetical protein
LWSLGIPVLWPKTEEKIWHMANSWMATPVLFQLFDFLSIYLWYIYISYDIYIYYRYFQGIPMTLEVTNQGHPEIRWWLDLMDFSLWIIRKSQRINQWPMMGCEYGFRGIGIWWICQRIGFITRIFLWTETECDDYPLAN